MTRMLQCSRRPERTSSRTLAVLANTTAAFPLFLVASLYGQWLLSWLVLGHQPRPSVDDPNYIAGASWMGFVTGLAFMGYVPVLVVAAALNTLHGLRHRNPGPQAALRISIVVALWLGTLALLRLDPGLVVSWWLD